MVVKKGKEAARHSVVEQMRCHHRGNSSSTAKIRLYASAVCSYFVDVLEGPFV